MTDEHNPVALLIYKIQDAWLQQISPNKNIQLIRWLINPEDIGFLQWLYSIRKYGTRPGCRKVFMFYLLPIQTWMGIVKSLMLDFIKIH